MSQIHPDNDFPAFATSGFQVAKETEKLRVETSSFTFGKETFFATHWKPLSQDGLKGIVFICHGYGEYFSPSYDEIAEALVEQGMLVIGHDHVGHGRSTGQRVQAQSLDDFVLPVIAHCKKIVNDFNSQRLPLYIIGHSMGGLITTYAAIREPDLFHGIVFMGPLIKMDPNVATPSKIMLANWFKSLLPSFSLGSLDATAITRDKTVVKRVEEDPLCWHGGFRTLLSYVLIKSVDDLKDGVLLKKISKPVLVFQGGQDKLVNPEGATFLNENVSSVDKKLVTYPEAFHNLFVELDDVKTAVIKETCDWITSHI